MKHIAIFASGNGTNAENVVKYFRSHPLGWDVSVIVCNKPDAYVLERAGRLGVPTEVVPRDKFSDPDRLLGVMDRYGVDAIVLAGFLLMIPAFLIDRYPDLIINIHPSLLPKFGGRGMYGHRVHEAVVGASERRSGITVHLVNEECDGGRILFRAETEVPPDDTPADVEAKIHILEQRHYPEVIARTLTGQTSN